MLDAWTADIKYKKYSYICLECFKKCNGICANENDILLSAKHISSKMMPLNREQVLQNYSGRGRRMNLDLTRFPESNTLVYI